MITECCVIRCTDVDGRHTGCCDLTQLPPRSRLRSVDNSPAARKRTAAKRWKFAVGGGCQTGQAGRRGRAVDLGSFLHACRGDLGQGHEVRGEGEGRR